MPFIKRIHLISIFFSLVNLCSAQDSTRFVVFQNIQAVKDVVKIPDGYFITGRTWDISGFHSPGVYRNIVVARLDEHMTPVWAYQYGGAYSDSPNQCILTSDSGLIVSGSTRSFGSSPTDLYMNLFMMKVAKDGELIWFKTYEHDDSLRSYINEGYHLYSRGDGHIIADGIVNTDANSGSRTDRIILKIKEDSGDLIDVFRIDCQNADNLGKGFVLTNDNGFLLGGVRGFKERGAATWEGELIKVDALGKVAWARSVGTTGAELNVYGGEVSLVAEVDGGYVYATCTQGAVIDGVDLLFSKFDPNGNLLWAKIYGTNNDDLIQLREFIEGPNNHLSCYINAQIPNDTAINNNTFLIEIDTETGSLTQQLKSNYNPNISITGRCADTLLSVVSGLSALLSNDQNGFLLSTENGMDLCEGYVDTLYLREDKETTIGVNSYACTSSEFIYAFDKVPMKDTINLNPVTICSKYIAQPKITTGFTSICPGTSVTMTSSLDDVWWSDEHAPTAVLGTGRSISVEPTRSTMYYVTASSEKKDSVFIEVKAVNDLSCVTLDIVEILTPNGDGKHDYFFIGDITKFLDYEVAVFNLYGDRVMHQLNYQNDWDGDDLPDGQYFYYIKIQDVNMELKGPLLIHR